MLKGEKVKIVKSDLGAVVGRSAIIELIAPDKGGDMVYKLRYGDIILPGWYHEEDLEKMDRPYTFIIFDLDGTLTDTSEGIMRCLRFALEQINITLEDIEELRPYVGRPVKEVLMQNFGLSEETADKVTSYYLEKYDTEGIFCQHLYPDIEGLLQYLFEEGYRLAIVSSKSQEDVDIACMMYHIQPLFERTLGNTGNTKTKAELLCQIVHEAGMDDAKESCVFIADRGADIQAARDCGINSIGVLWSYGSMEEFSQRGAANIVSDVEKLLILL